MSIIRLGLSEKESCAEGYEAIFGKKKPAEKSAAQAKPAKPSPEPKKKKGAKK